MISINCPKCGKNYKLTEELKGKKMKCVCGEIFTENEAIIDLKETVKSSKGHYIKESYQFIGKNIISLILYSLIISVIISGLIYTVTKWTNLSALNIVIIFIFFSITSTFVIQLIKGLVQNSKYSLIQAIKDSANILFSTMLANLINSLILFVALLPFLVGISYITQAVYLNASGGTGVETGVALMALTGMILFVIGIILLLILSYPLTKYTLALQNSIFNGNKVFACFKESGKNTYGHKWRILGIELLFNIIYFIIWFIIIYLLSLVVPKDEIGIYIILNTTIFCWLIMKINLHVVFTHLFINITGTKEIKEVK